MDEPKRTNSPATADAAGAGTHNAARHEEATSSDTLSDLQQTQTDSTAAQSGASAASDSSSAPSPDGTPDTTSGVTADGRDSGGPM
jgi:hypothetical protein